jgi:hypothetical protein
MNKDGEEQKSRLCEIPKIKLKNSLLIGYRMGGGKGQRESETTAGQMHSIG